MSRFKEEVINVILAELLIECGLPAEPETIRRRKAPDVFIPLEGVKVNLEGRFVNSAASKTLKNDVRKRIEQGIAEIGAAVNYPEDLREAEGIVELKEKLKNVLLDTTIIYYASSGLKMIGGGGLNLQRLAETIQNTFSLIIKNDIVKQEVQEVQKVIEETTMIASRAGGELFFNSEKVVAKLKAALGITEEKSEKKERKRY
jgi:hypothetical protein